MAVLLWDSVAIRFTITTLALCMFVGRFGVIIPMLALREAWHERESFLLVKAHSIPKVRFFITLLVATIVLTGALTFFPSLALGPVIEHLMMLERISF